MSDEGVVREFLDRAVDSRPEAGAPASMGRSVAAAFGEGYWLGRGIQHASQNALDPDWLRNELDARGLEDWPVLS